jgi:hypothetical protein
MVWKEGSIFQAQDRAIDDFKRTTGTGSVGATFQLGATFPRVGMLTAADSDRTPIFNAFREGLRDLGYVEGRNIVLEFRLAHGDFSLLPKLATELVSLPVDIIVADNGLDALVHRDPHHPDCGHDGRPDVVWARLQPVAAGWERHGLHVHAQGTQRQAAGGAAHCISGYLGSCRPSQPREPQLSAEFPSDRGGRSDR